MQKINIIILIVVGIVAGAMLVYYAYPNMVDSNISNPTVAEEGDMVAVHYTGKTTDGQKFDSSLDRGQPFSFKLGAGMVIRGWDEGIVGMKKGEKKTLTISSDKAYGAQGVPDGKGGYIISPNATLIFDVELLDIKRR
ncbi:MAG: FKBP-type peptidyl-prolyl cis-trans isomerase [Candidatus Pacebacteria bacterium]|nr:FKBP-type peptidyl-prolyl cis-trans isomerase [Candidatus Paceibacterota bacterium]